MTQRCSCGVAVCNANNKEKNSCYFKHLLRSIDAAQWATLRDIELRGGSAEASGSAWEQNVEQGHKSQCTLDLTIWIKAEHIDDCLKPVKYFYMSIFSSFWAFLLGSQLPVLLNLPRLMLWRQLLLIAESTEHKNKSKVIIYCFEHPDKFLDSNNSYWV